MGSLMYTLFVDDSLPADKQTLDLCLSTSLPIVIIPTTGFPDAYLRYYEDGESKEIKGNKAIRDFLFS